MGKKQVTRQKGARGETRLTMNEIAKLAGVSAPTVSRVLSGSPLVTQEKRDRVLEVARAHSYAANRNAQRLRSARTSAVAVVLDFASHRQGSIGDPFIFELLAGISEALSVRDQELLLSPPGLNDVGAFADFFAGRGADGFIILGQGTRDPMLRALARQPIPLVVWGAVSKDSGYCTVGSDNFTGGRLAGEHFVRKRRKKWLFIGDTAHKEIQLRYEGLKAVADEQVDVSVELLSVETMASSAAATAVTDYLDSGERPDAVFSFSDTAAMAACSSFRTRKLSAPKDFSLVGYNNIPPAAHFSPGLTTINQRTDVAGALLVEKLMQQIDGGRAVSIMLPTQIVIRET